jgi:hypothetical protein
METISWEGLGTEEEIGIAQEVYQALRGLTKCHLKISPKWDTLHNKWKWDGSKYEFINLVDSMRLHRVDGSIIKPTLLSTHVDNRHDEIFNHNDLQLTLSGWLNNELEEYELDLSKPHHKFIYFSLTNCRRLQYMTFPSMRILSKDSCFHYVRR